MNQRRAFLLALVAAVCGLHAGCGASSGAKPQPAARDSAAAPAPVAVNVIEARAVAAGGDLLVPAAISIENTALVLARRDGTILRLAASEGQRVAEGQTLAQLDDDEQRAQLRQLEVEVSRLRIEEDQYRALVNVNRNELEREQTLARDGLTSKAQVERAQYRLDVARAESERARLATQGAQARVEAARLELAKSNVRAPRGGVVTRRHVSLGTGVVKGDKLFEIAELAPLTVKFQVPQAGAARLSVGQVLTLSLADERAVAQARVRRVDPVADAASSTSGYLADVVGGGGLAPGLTVNVHVPRAGGAALVWIPRAAFPAGSDPRPGASSALYVLQGDRCVERQVWINSEAGDQVEITTGLAPGELVILAPPNGLKPGDLVRAN